MPPFNKNEIYLALPRSYSCEAHQVSCQKKNMLDVCPIGVQEMHDLWATFQNCTMQAEED